jgi:hypothetical protein
MFLHYLFPLGGVDFSINSLGVEISVCRIIIMYKIFYNLLKKCQKNIGLILNIILWTKYVNLFPHTDIYTDKETNKQINQLIHTVYKLSNKQIK